MMSGSVMMLDCVSNDPQEEQHGRMERVTTPRPCYRKLVFNYWAYLHLLPLRTNATFTERERRTGTRFYLCTFHGCKGYFNTRRTCLELHLKRHHGKDIQNDKLKVGCPAWWEYTPLVTDSAAFAHRKRITVKALISLEISPTEEPVVLHESKNVSLVRHLTQSAHGVNYHNPEAGTDGSAFFMPTLSLIGAGSLNAAGVQIAKLGYKKALVVTDKVLVKVGAVDAILKVLDKIKVPYVIYDGTEPNPTDKQVDEGLKLLKEEKCDFIVSFGGSSPHDCAKAIGVLATNGGKIHDYEGVDKTQKTILPLISINTAAGTAAELTRFSIITDTSRQVKMTIIDWKITPTIAVDDPTLMVGMHRSLTATTGMDALTHAIEAYVSTISNPLTDAFALHAMRLITTYLRDAVNDDKNLKARDMMSYAEFLAGMAFNNASLGYVHAMAHQLGGMYKLPHGVCSAVLLPVVQELNAKKVPVLFINIADAFGFKNVGEDADLAVKLVLEEIRSLSKDVGIPRNLKELGIKPVDFEELSKNAMKDACGFANPRVPTKEEVVQLFRNAYEQ